MLIVVQGKVGVDREDQLSIWRSLDIKRDVDMRERSLECLLYSILVFVERFLNLIAYTCIACCNLALICCIKNLVEGIER